MPKKRGRVRLMPARKVKSANFSNLHVIVDVNEVPPNRTMTPVPILQQASVPNASPGPKTFPPNKAPPLKEKVQQKGGLSLAKKVIDKAKSFLTDKQLTFKDNPRKGNIPRNVTVKQAKNNKAPIPATNTSSPSKKVNTESKESTKKGSAPPKDSSLVPKRTPEKVTRSNAASRFSEGSDKRIVRMKESASDARKDVEHERRVTRQSSRRYSRESLEQKEITKKDMRSRKYEEERKRPSTSRRFSSHREKYYEERYRSSRREREKHSRNYNWGDSDFRTNPYEWRKKDSKPSKTAKKDNKSKEIDNLEEISDGPMDDADFEEVEVASVEEAEKSSVTPVGFRKYHARYLSFKSRGFFKPKLFNISSERTIVSCLNVKGNDAVSKGGNVSVDSVSKLKQDKNSSDKVVEKTDDSAEEVMEVESSSQVENNLVQDDVNEVEMEAEKSDGGDTDIVELSSEGSCPETNNSNSVEQTDTDVSKETNASSVKQECAKSVGKNTGGDSVKKILDVGSSKEMTADASPIGEKTSDKNSTKKPSQDTDSFAEDAKAGVCSANGLNSAVAVVGTKSIVESAVQNVNATASFNKITNMELVDSSTDEKRRIYCKSISEEKANKDFYQGAAKIQSHLDAWKSHLIGLEYIIEVHNNLDEPNVKMYYCWLCTEEVWNKNMVGQTVIGHINSYEHMLKYMAKHFPSCGYNFSESVKNYNTEIVLRKCCEEVNRKIGYYFMSITNLDYFSNHKNDINEILTLKKFDINIDVDLHLSELESAVSKEVSVLLCEIIDRLFPVKGISTFITQRDDNYQHLSRKKIRNSNDAIAEVSAESGRNLILLTPLLESPLPVSKPTPVAPLNHASLSSMFKNLVPVPTQEIAPVQNVTQSSDVAKEMGNESKVSPKKNVPVEKDEKSVPMFGKSKEKIEAAYTNYACKEANSIRKYRSLYCALSSFKPKKVAKGSVAPPAAVQSKENKAGAKPSSKEVESTEKAPVVDKKDSSSSMPPAVADSKTNIQKEDNISLSSSKKSDPVAEEIDHVEESGPVEEGEAVEESEAVEAVEEESEAVEEDEEGVEADEGEAVEEESEAVEGEEDEEGEAVEEDEPIVEEGEPIEEIEPVEVESDPAEEGDFVDMPVEEVVPKRKSTQHRSHSRSSQHSKYCIKRILSRSSKLHKEASTKKDVPSRESDSGDSNEITILSEKYPSSGKRVDELNSQDSRHSTSSIKRERSPSNRSSRSPSLPYNLLKALSRSRSRSPNERSLSSLKNRSSPSRKRSRSPVRLNRSSNRGRSRSPLRRLSRSPLRRRSRSPIRKRSRSPLRRRSRSPIRRRSRSPIRKRSRSPLRKRSRSPIRKRSRSPIKRRSRSPIRRRSRSPIRRRSRSPLKRRSRSPIRRRSRSPLRMAPRPFGDRPISLHRPLSPLGRLSRRLSRSPVRRKSKSPIRRSPSKKLHSVDYRRIGDALSANWKQPSSSRSSKSDAGSRHRSTKYSKREESAIGDLSDLDPISDEDESKYFATTEKLQHMDVIMKLPEPTRSMIVQLLGKYCGPENVTPSDPLFSEFMQFVNSNCDSLQEYAGGKSPSTIMDVIAGKQAPPNRHQYLSNLVGNMVQPRNMPFPTPVPGTSGGIPFPPPSVAPPFQPSNMQFPGPTGIRPPHAYPQHGLTSTPQHMPFQSNQFAGIPQNQPPPRLPKAPSEVVFKDLKATVSKLFGANDLLQNLSVPNPGVAHPSTPDFMPKQEAPAWNPNPTVPQANPGNFTGTLRSHNYSAQKNPQMHYKPQGSSDMLNMPPRLSVPPPDTKVSFCDAPAASLNRNLFPVVSRPDPGLSNVAPRSTQSNVNVAKISLAQRLAAVLVKFGMVDVSASLLQEMLMKIGAFSSNPPQDINEAEIVEILRRLGYLL